MKSLSVLFLFVFMNCTPDTQSIQPAALAGMLLISIPQKISIPLKKEMADTIVSAPSHTGQGFKNKNNAINGVRGGGYDGGSTDVYTLDQTGIGAELILRWSNRVITNGTGIDFIVFENPFRINQNSNKIFLEPIIVEVSRDNLNYCGFNPTYSNLDQTQFSQDPSHWVRFAGINPVLYHEEENNLKSNELFDLTKSGGDGFDLNDLSDDDSFNIGCSTVLKDLIQNEGFEFLRLISASARTNLNTNQPYPIDPLLTIQNNNTIINGGPDIDGVFARNKKEKASLY
jgi:hypothetical protein